MMDLHRTIDTIPVLVKAGGIIPLQAEEELSSRTDNPLHLEIHAFCGANGEFTLYEDDGVSMGYEDGRFCHTHYRLDWGAKRFEIDPSEGDLSLIPKQRRYTVVLHGISAGSVEAITVDGQEICFQEQADQKKNLLSLELGTVGVCSGISVQLRASTDLAENNVLELAYDALNRAQIPFAHKETLYKLLQSDASTACKLSTIQTMSADETMKSVLMEFLLA